MLAAVPESNSALGLLQVVLTSISHHQEVEISDALKTHVIEILRLASDVATNPNSISSKTPSEALELALRMRGHTDLCNQISQIQSFNGIQTDVAEKLLDSLRPYAA